MSVDKSKKFSLIPEKVIHSLILLLLQLCKSRSHRYSIYFSQCMEKAVKEKRNPSLVRGSEAKAEKKAN